MVYGKLEFIFTVDSFLMDDVDNKKFKPADENWRQQFQKDKYKALYELGFEDAKNDESQSMSFLHFLSEIFLETLTNQSELELTRENAVIVLDEAMRNRLLNSVPFALGTENINEFWLNGIFDKLAAIYRKEISKYKGTVAEYLSRKRKDLRIPERVFFHLVEDKDDEEYPFAFLATYATKDKRGKIRHVPLKYALSEFKGEHKKLLNLLSCLNKAAEVSPLIDQLVKSGEMLHPLHMGSKEAYEILKAVPSLEENGILCRIPNWWKRRNASSVKLSVKFGEKDQSLVGFDSLIAIQPELTIDGMKLTRPEIIQILQSTAGLALIKGKWIEVDKEHLMELLDKMDEYDGEISFLDALKLESGVDEKSEEEKDVIFTNGQWLEKTLQKLRRPVELKNSPIPENVKADLRPYQVTGYSWLRFMARLKLGACLADDMGLGKTLEILTFLESVRCQKPDAKFLLIVPASLLGNWEKESARFTPKIDLYILHGQKKEKLEEELNGELHFLTVTTYTMAARLEGLSNIVWDGIILDEAQAIKNPGAKQTKSIKKIPSRLKMILTGTPIENDLSNLWSLFDFLNKGLLGSAAEFKRYSSNLNRAPENYQKLRKMLSPFILRRLKTDKSIIADLPDKLEQIDYVSLSKKQIVLYRDQVKKLENTLQSTSGIARKGIILSTITKLKQICNHPDQFLGLTAYNPTESGKFELMKEICETIYEKRERVLVFTQYKEITDYLAEFLSEVFKRNGLILHGGTPIQKRTEMVELFNSEKYIPFMVLSVKAGGVGLNLTAANHVIHFDRWWNPAVENQATDRAFRIGQEKNVMVHKFVSKGTVEERIDAIIQKKITLAENIISAGEQWITEFSNEEIISMMRLES